jgi:hypothetical protein
MAHDVFISHSNQDKAIADAVCATLERNKIRCWIAPRDVIPGVVYAEALIDALNQSKIMVLVFSSSSNKSIQVMREVERAVNKGIAIIPFRIENVVPSKAMEYFLSVPHWLDALTPPLEKHLQKLSDTVQALLLEMSKPVVTDNEYVVAETRPVETIKKVRRPNKWVIISLIAFIVIAGSITGIVLANQGKLEPTPTSAITQTPTPISDTTQTPAPTPIVSIPDSNLDSVIRAAINKPTEPIHPSDLESITTLVAQGKNISDLTGIEHCVNLKVLQIYGNVISDITPLRQLTGLRELYIYQNNITDVSPLAGLVELEQLWLGRNNISDISPLRGLTNLNVLVIIYNNISDISPLIENGGLSDGDTVNLIGNSLDSTSMNVYIPQLKARGVDVLIQ